MPIHNAVNEKAWEEILKWESQWPSEKCGGPRLVSFVGRPKERTPKAWVKTALGWVFAVLFSFIVLPLYLFTVSGVFSPTL